MRDEAATFRRRDRVEFEIVVFFGGNAFKIDGLRFAVIRFEIRFFAFRHRRRDEFGRDVSVFVGLFYGVDLLAGTRIRTRLTIELDLGLTLRLRGVLSLRLSGFRFRLTFRFFRLNSRLFLSLAFRFFFRETLRAFLRMTARYFCLKTFLLGLTTRAFLRLTLGFLRSKSRLFLRLQSCLFRFDARLFIGLTLRFFRLATRLRLRLTLRFFFRLTFRAFLRLAFQFFFRLRIAAHRRRLQLRGAESERRARGRDRGLDRFRLGRQFFRFRFRLHGLRLRRNFLLLLRFRRDRLRRREERAAIEREDGTRRRRLRLDLLNRFGLRRGLGLFRLDRDRGIRIGDNDFLGLRFRRFDSLSIFVLVGRVDRRVVVMRGLIRRYARFLNLGRLIRKRHTKAISHRR